MVKEVFLLNAGKRNTFAYVTPSNPHDIFLFIERPQLKLPSVKI